MSEIHSIRSSEAVSKLCRHEPSLVCDKCAVEKVKDLNLPIGKNQRFSNEKVKNNLVYNKLLTGNDLDV